MDKKLFKQAHADAALAFDLVRLAQSKESVDVGAKLNDDLATVREMATGLIGAFHVTIMSGGYLRLVWGDKTEIKTRREFLTFLRNRFDHVRGCAHSMMCEYAAVWGLFQVMDPEEVLRAIERLAPRSEGAAERRDVDGTSPK